MRSFVWQYLFLLEICEDFDWPHTWCYNYVSCWCTGKKWLKSSGKIPLYQACINLRACRRYTLVTVNISKILRKGGALSVFLPDRVAPGYNTIRNIRIEKDYNRSA